ncbi:MAG TPA: glycosyltransferase family 87 protein [Candidatus Sulfopaludibacter sp.]|jgi:hypothetical protein|nr:glycosyltransferase family 87 protein [Candidatus Sulfopaludibacter sp.]
MPILIRPQAAPGLGRSDLRYLNVIGWLIVTALYTIIFQRSLRPDQERDFVYFYSFGYIFNHHPVAHLYDYQLQTQVCAQLQPMHDGAYGPNPYPPFVAAVFSLIARLPYLAAYKLWMAVTLTLYLGGTGLLVSRFFPRDRLKQSLVLCYALLFWPFAARTFLNGQIAAVGLFAMALAVFYEDASASFSSGLALSICLYKPTFLILILPVLVIIRRFRTLAGFATGAAGLISLTTILLGPGVWLAYARMLSGLAAFRPHLHFDDHVDLYSFSVLIAHGAPVVQFLGVCVAAVAVAYLLRASWLQRIPAQSGSASLLWAATLSWTLLLNVYVPIQDSILVLVSLIASAPQLWRMRRRVFLLTCAALLLVAPFSGFVAAETGFQMLTLVLGTLAFLQTRLLTDGAVSCQAVSESQNWQN